MNYFQDDFTHDDPAQNPFQVPADQGFVDEDFDDVAAPEAQGYLVQAGFLDGIGQFEVIDLGADGVGDILGIDTNGDGIADFSVVRDGDQLVLTADGDFDGTADWQEVVTPVELLERYPLLSDVINSVEGFDLFFDIDHQDTQLPWREIDQDVVDDGFEVSDGVIHGDPFLLEDTWFEQSFNGACLPASVAQIYMEYTGVELTDQEFVNLANAVFQSQEGGWVIGPDGAPGLPPQAAETLLESAGIPASYETGLTLEDLERAVDQGPVMVAVDSGEYWYGESVEDDTMDHAVVVTAVGPLVDEDGNVVLDAGGNTTEVVYLSDTGTGDGNVLPVPVDVFLDAWEDSGFAAVTCDISADDFRAAQEGLVLDADQAAAGGTEIPALAPLDVITPDNQIEETASWMAQHPSWWIVPVRLIVPAAIASLAAVGIAKAAKKN